MMQGSVCFDKTQSRHRASSVCFDKTQSRHRVSSVCFDKTYKADTELVLPSPGPVVVVVVPSSDQLLSGKMFCR